MADVRRRHQRIVGIIRERRTPVDHKRIAARKIKTRLRADDHFLPTDALAVTVIEEIQTNGRRFPRCEKIQRHSESEQASGARCQLGFDVRNLKRCRRFVNQQSKLRGQFRGQFFDHRLNSGLADLGIGLHTPVRQQLECRYFSVIEYDVNGDSFRGRHDPGIVVDAEIPHGVGGQGPRKN